MHKFFLKVGNIIIRNEILCSVFRAMLVIFDHLHFYNMCVLRSPPDLHTASIDIANHAVQELLSIDVLDLWTSSWVPVFGADRGFSIHSVLHDKEASSKGQWNRNGAAVSCE